MKRNRERDYFMLQNEVEAHGAKVEALNVSKLFIFCLSLLNIVKAVE